jgi:hypothetical protein
MIYLRYLIIVLLLIAASDHNVLTCKSMKKIKKEFINEN